VKQYGAHKHSLADALKDVARVLFGMTKKDGPLLQTLGTEVFRKQDPDVWVRCLYYKLQDQQPPLVVVPDVRFSNEIRLIREMGGKLIHIRRFLQDGTRFISTDRPTDHPSETALDGYTGWDYTIDAKDGDFDGIYRAVDEIMQATP
jgi:hypothetical protein